MRKNKKYLRKKRAKRIVKASLISLLSLVVVLVASAAFYVNFLLNKVDYDHDDPTYESIAIETDDHGNIKIPGELSDATKPTSSSGTGGSEEEPVEEPVEEPDPEATPVPDDEASKIADEAKGYVNDDTPIASSKDVINILLIGVDSRVPGRNGNSDVMMLLSINRQKKTITLSSLMRDMYVAIPGVGNTKLNHANAISGPALLLQTVRQNFKVDVNHYMMVDFYSMATIVDTLGGVTINVSEAERPLVNSSVRETNRQQGREIESGLLASSGTVNLTGAQTVGYSRIRYVGNADFGRTQRQRTVMTAIFNKVKGSSVGTLNNLVNVILPLVKTNLSKGDILTYMTWMPQAASYPIQQIQIPANGQYRHGTIGGLSYLIPNIPENRKILHNAIY